MQLPNSSLTRSTCKSYFYNHQVSLYLIGIKNILPVFKWLPRWLSGKEFAHQCRRCKRRGFDSWAGKIPWSRKWSTYSSNLAWEIPWTEELGGATVHRAAKSQTQPSRYARTDQGRRQQGSETSKRRKASHRKIKKRTTVWSTNVCWAM